MSLAEKALTEDDTDVQLVRKIVEAVGWKRAREILSRLR
jgi:hypothetical protein